MSEKMKLQFAAEDLLAVKEDIEDCIKRVTKILHDVEEICPDTQSIVERASRYWLPELTIALTNDHSFLARKMCVMESTIRELEDAAKNYVEDEAADDYT